jgi:hypothetical protein
MGLCRGRAPIATGVLRTSIPVTYWSLSGSGQSVWLAIGAQINEQARFAPARRRAPRVDVQLVRRRPYRLVWEAPAREVARRFGIDLHV